jgi:hypothetical protein
MYGFNGFLYFAYQTLDGSDGKQARATGSGSPLGELMDHGVDAVTTSLIAYFTMDTMGFGLNTPYPWIVICSGQTGFILSNLTLLHKGRQVFNTIDIMELQTTMIGSLVVTWLMGGPAFWQTTMPTIPHEGLAAMIAGVKFTGPHGINVDWSNGIPMRDAIVGVSAFGAIFNSCCWTKDVLCVYLLGADKDRPLHVKAKVRGTGLKAFFFQFACIAVLQTLLWMCFDRAATTAVPSSTNGTTTGLVCLVITSAFAFGDLMDRILLLRIGQLPLRMPPPCLFTMTSFYFALGHSLEATYLCTAVSVLMHLSFFVRYARAISSAYGIHPFLISGKWKPKKKK